MDKMTFRREPPRFAANHRVSPRTTVTAFRREPQSCNLVVLCNVKSYIILHRDTREPPRFAANHSHRVSPRTTVTAFRRAPPSCNLVVLCNVKSYIILHRDTRAP
jgi:hypothetical protein